MDLEIQLTTLSQEPNEEVPIEQKPRQLANSTLLSLFVLSLLSCFFHLYFFNYFLQEFGIISSILMQLLTTHLMKRPSTQKLSFGYTRAHSISILFSCLFLLMLSICNSFAQTFTLIEESPTNLHLLVMVINAIQLMLLHRSKNIIQIYVIWSISSHLLTILASAHTKYLTLALDLSICVLGCMRITPDLFEVMLRSPFDSEVLENSIKCVEGVLDLHDFHIWQVGSKVFVHFHIVTSDRSILKPIKKICKLHGVPKATIQLELEGFNCKSHKLH